MTCIIILVLISIIQFGEVMMILMLFDYFILANIFDISNLSC